MSKEHDDVYVLIAQTSVLLRKKVRELGPKPKYPKYIREIQGNLTGVNNGTDTISAMKGFIRKYG